MITWDNAKKVLPGKAPLPIQASKSQLLFPWQTTSNAPAPGTGADAAAARRAAEAAAAAAAAAKKKGGGSPSGGYSTSPTSQQKSAAKNQRGISKFNAQTVKDEWKAANANYDQSDKQNRARAKQTMRNNAGSASSDRFAQMRKMQSATSGLMSGAGNALQGSQALGVAGMLRSRNDLDSGETFNTLRTNQNAAIDSLNESLNANALARNAAAAAAERGLRGIEADLAAQLNNINPKLYKEPGKGTTNMGSKNYAKKRKSTPKLKKAQGYFTSAPQSTTAPASQNTGSSYYDRLMSGGY